MRLVSLPGDSEVSAIDNSGSDKNNYRNYADAKERVRYFYELNHSGQTLEFAQAKKWSQPVYRVVEELGPSHDRVFTVEVLVQNRSLGEGTAKNKKTAEQLAAKSALSSLPETDAE